MLRSILWDKHGQTQIPSSRRRTQVDPGVVDLHFNVNSNVRVLRQNVWTSAIPTPKKSNESDWSRRLWRSIKSMNSMEFIIVYLSPHAKPTSAVGNLPGSLPEWQYHHLPICNRHSTRLIRTVNLCNLGTCGLWSRTQLGRGWSRTEMGCRPLNGGLNVGVILPEGNTKANLENCIMEVSWNWGTPKSSILIRFSIVNHPAIGVPPCMEPPRWFCATKTERPTKLLTPSLPLEEGRTTFVYCTIY